MDPMVVRPPWTATLTDGQHTLVLFAVVAAALALLATLVRVRFASAEVHGEYRTASLTANSVVAIALASYVLLVVSLAAGYTRTAAGWTPNAVAPFAWSLRYADWAVTVPLLVVELLAVSIVFSERRAWIRAAGMSLAFVMVFLGFLGAFVVGDGQDFTALLVLGLISAVCFMALTGLLLGVALRSLPRLPAAARPPYRAAVAVLLITWFVYPIVYGLQGTTSGGGWAVVGVVALSVADIVAKVGFGSLIHRTGVLRSPRRRGRLTHHRAPVRGSRRRTCCGSRTRAATSATPRSTEAACPTPAACRDGVPGTQAPAGSRCGGYREDPPPRTLETSSRRPEVVVQQVHFCSGSVFVTGDRIAMSLLRYVAAVATAHRNDVVAVPTVTRSGNTGTVTLMVNGVSQISADSHEHAGPELEDDAFVARLDALTTRLSVSAVWLGEVDPLAAA